MQPSQRFVSWGKSLDARFPTRSPGKNPRSCNGNEPGSCSSPEWRWRSNQPHLKVRLCSAHRKFAGLGRRATLNSQQLLEAGKSWKCPLFHQMRQNWRCLVLTRGTTFDERKKKKKTPKKKQTQQTPAVRASCSNQLDHEGILRPSVRLGKRWGVQQQRSQTRSRIFSKNNLSVELP